MPSHYRVLIADTKGQEDINQMTLRRSVNAFADREILQNHPMPFSLNVRMIAYYQDGSFV